MEKKIYFAPQVEEVKMEPTGCLMTSFDPYAPAPRRRGGGETIE